MTTNVNVSRYDYGDYYRGRTVVAAVFDDRADVERAINALRDAGFPGDRIGVALRDRTAQGELMEETGATGTVKTITCGVLSIGLRKVRNSSTPGWRRTVGIQSLRALLEYTVSCSRWVGRSQVIT